MGALQSSFKASGIRLHSNQWSILHSTVCRTRGGPACCSSWSRSWPCSLSVHDTAVWGQSYSSSSPLPWFRSPMGCWHLNPLPWISVVRSWYLSVFLLSAASMLVEVSQTHMFETCAHVKYHFLVGPSAYIYLRFFLDTLFCIDITLLVNFWKLFLNIWENIPLNCAFDILQCAFWHRFSGLTLPEDKV